MKRIDWTLVLIVLGIIACSVVIFLDASQPRTYTVTITFDEDGGRLLRDVLR